MSMSDDPHFNVFHHYGDKAFHEDNFTRALWIVLSRSQYSDELTRRLLHFLAQQKDARDDVREALQDANWNQDFCFDLQVTSFDPKEHQSAKKILLGIAPKVPLANRDEDAIGDSRPDACLITGKVAILFENKVWGTLDENQLARHARMFGEGGADQEIRIDWQALIQFFNDLPGRIRDTLLVRDFVALVSEQPHLVPDFLGLTPEDLNNPNWRTETRLAKLAEIVKQRCEFVVDYHRLSGGCDWDIYATDQPDLVGNMGFCCWGGGEFRARIAIGNTQIQENIAFDSPPRFSGRYGMDRLLSLASSEPGIDFRKIGRQNPGTMFSPFVLLRRAQAYKWFALREGFSGKELANDPRLLFDELTRLHTYGETVSDAILDEIKESHQDFVIENHRIPEGKTSRSGFYQTAGLLVIDELKVDKVKSMSADEQIEWLVERLASYHSILHAFSLDFPPHS